MANYKEIITGTISDIVDKFKASAENGKINDVVGKVKDAAENSSVYDVCNKGANAAKAYAQIAKLSLELNGETEELKKVYAEIGRLYYDQAKEAPEGYFAPLFANAEALQGSVDEKQATIDALKASVNECAKDVEVEVAVEDAEESETAPVEEAEAEVTPAVTADIEDFETIVSESEEENK